MRRGGLALIALLILGGVTGLMFPGGPSAPVAPENKAATTRPKVPAQDAKSDLDNAQESVEWYPAQVREKIRDFFGVEHGQDVDPFETQAKQKNVCVSVENWCVPSGYRHGIQFVIATAPDPVHTHLGLFFDRSIDAIEQGATSRNYFFDRAIMPWQYFVAPTDEETGEEKVLRKVRESYPGLMIFRGGPTNRPLFVLVVGETPTAGINKQQFHRAVEMIHEIREGKDSVSPNEDLDFAVLGPTFSGSLFSLQQILYQYVRELPSDPRSGTRVIPVYSNVMGTEPIQDFGKQGPPQVRMAVFTEDGLSQINALLTYTEGLGYSDSAVTALNEDDTAYGGTGLLEGAPPQGIAAVSSQAATAHHYVTLSFPRGISEFRSAYSKDLQNQDQSSDPNQPRRNLRLDLEVTGSDDDNVAPYATAQTALSQEAVMLSIVAELRRYQSKFILLRATDPLDELFLARYLSSQYPDARLVIPTPDLLFARQEGGVLDGVLGLNTYPVSPSYLNPVCVDPRGSVFPAAPSAGLFNSTAALLGGLASPVQERAVLTGEVERAAAPLNPCTLSPNLWLTVVSRTAIYPIAVLRSEGSAFFPQADQPSRVESDKRSGPIPPLWAMLWVLCLALVANHVRCVWNPKTLGYWQTAKQSQDADQFSNGGSWIVGKACILWLGAMVLVAMTVVFLSSVTPFFRGVDRYGSLSIGLVSSISLILFTFVVTYDFFAFRKERLLAILFLLFAGCFAWAGISFAYSRSGKMVLWQQRTILLDSHVSSATPLLLLLAAFYAWFWFSLKAESLTDWRCARLPSGEESPKGSMWPNESAASRIREAIHALGGPWWVHCWAVLVVGLLAVQGIKAGPGGIPVRSLEGISSDICYTILLALAVLLLIATFLRSVAVWWELQSLLRALNRPGMRQALKSLKGFGWEVIWNPLQSMKDEVTRLYLKEFHVVERLKESLRHDGETATSPAIAKSKTDLEGIATLLHSIYDVASSGKRARSEDAEKLMSGIKNMQIKFASAASALCSAPLDALWRALPADDEGESGQAQSTDSSATMTVSAAITEADNPQRTKNVSGTIKKVEDSGPSGFSEKSLRLAEEFVACVYATFITIVLLRIRWLVFSSVVIYTAVVFSANSYPFEPAAGLRFLALLLFLLGAAVVGYVYEEMHSDPTLRNMTSTDPNKIDTAFWLKLISAGLLPLLGVLTSLFPQVGHFLYMIAAPILQATR